MTPSSIARHTVWVVDGDQFALMLMFLSVVFSPICVSTYHYVANGTEKGASLMHIFHVNVPISDLGKCFWTLLTFDQVRHLL